MKVALVHELLTTRGGAERVAKVMADMFPDAPVYTLLYNERKMGDLFPKERVRPSILHRSVLFHALPAPLRFNHHLYLSEFPEAVERWDFSGYDLVLSSSSAFAHGIITNGNPRHLCYVHSPARYLWDSTHDVLERAGRGILGPLKRRYLEKKFHDLRIWDSETSERPDALLVNSETVRRRIELYWRRESEVLHPPVDDFWFEGGPSDEKRDGYLIVSTLSPYKRIDLAIAACNAANTTLLIVGEGRDRGRLERMAGPRVRFLGHRSNSNVRDLYRRAKAVLFPGEDDFGLVPVEAQACGTPVIAYRAGGARETVIEGTTGTFFDEPTHSAIIAAMERFERSAFDPSACREHVRRFGTARFRAGLERAIAETLKGT